MTLPRDTEIASIIDQLKRAINGVAEMETTMTSEEILKNPKLFNSLRETYKKINEALTNLTGTRIYRQRIGTYGKESYGAYPTSEEEMTKDHR